MSIRRKQLTMTKLSKITLVGLIAFASSALITISLKTVGLENSVSLFQIASSSAVVAKNGLDIADKLRKNQVDDDTNTK